MPPGRLRIFAALCCALALAAACRRVAQSDPTRPLLVLLVSIDTLRADHLRSYGGPVAAPNIEALAADGVLYRAAFSHSPQTLPSHASLLTGLLPFQHGARDNVGFTLDANVTTLAQRLRSAGYATGAAVSSYVLRKETGVDRGFDSYDSQLTMAAGPNVTVAQVQRPGAETLAIAKNWIAQHEKAPAFFFLHFYEPHTPYAPPSPYREQYLNPYDGEIAYSDSLIGDLVAFLKERGLYDSALIVLVSDHGEGLGDHGEQEHGIFLYQSVAHVPMVIKWPFDSPDSAGLAQGRAGPNRPAATVAAAVQLIDIAPTIAALTGAAPDPLWRGFSLVDDPDRAGAPVRSVYSESMYPRYHFGWSELYALTDGRFRYILAPRDELYDLEKDAGEANNLATERRSTRDAMRAALTPFVQPAASVKPREVSAADLEKFQALGYIGMSVQTTGAPDQSLPDPKDKIGIFKLYREAIELARSGKHEGAIAAYKQIVAENPGMVDVWERLATTLQAANRGDEAMLVLRRIIAIAPDNAGAHLRLGRALVRRRRFEDAAAEAHAALQQNPAEANELLARISYERGAPDAAVKFAEAAVQVDPKLALPFYIQGLVRYQRGECAEALPLFERAVTSLAARPGLTVPGLYLHLGDCLFRANRRDEAERALMTEVKLYPDDVQARLRLAGYYLTTNQKPRFVELFMDLIRQAPTPDNYRLAIRALTDAGETKAAADLAHNANAHAR